MSATMKHIPTTSSNNLDDYLGREKEGNDLPRVLYEAGQHCRPATAKAEFRALREEHGRQGEMRTVPGKYVEPENLADATHLKVGKNWREAKPGETATHQRIEPKVPVEKRPEAFHFVYSFDLATVNPEDPEATRKAFEAVVAFRQQDTPGTQSKFVAHGDAKGSKVAIERGEGGKFHVHEAMNAVVHTGMEVDDRTFEAGQRVGGPITHVDTMRKRWDKFLETRGHEFGLGPQDRSVLPEVGSPEYGAVRNNNKDFWAREHGELSDHDRARRGMETAFEQLSQDPSTLAGLDENERLRRLADEVGNTGDVELKLRETKAGDVKIRSFVVPGRKQAIGSTKLGHRYDNAGVAEQLQLISDGRWKPYERPQVGEAKAISKLDRDEVNELQKQADALALDEQREVELDRWMADWAADEGITVEQLWDRREMTGTPAERKLAHGWKEIWDKEQAAAARQAEEQKYDIEPFRQEYGEEMALLSGIYAEDHLRKNPRDTAADAELVAEGRLKARAYNGDLASDLEYVRSQTAAGRETAQVQHETPKASSRNKETSIKQTSNQKETPTRTETKKVETEPKSPVKRQERQVGVLSAEQRKDVELIAVIHKERADGGAYVDFQIEASDPAADGQRGLHLLAKTQQREDGRSTTRLWRQLNENQYRRLRDAAGDNRTEVDGRQVLAVRTNVMTSLRDQGYTIDGASMKPSQRQRIGTDVLDRQRAAEDQVREVEKDKPKPSERVGSQEREAEIVSTNKGLGR